MARTLHRRDLPGADGGLPRVGHTGFGPDATCAASIFSMTLSDARGRGECSPSRRYGRCQSVRRVRLRKPKRLPFLLARVSRTDGQQAYVCSGCHRWSRRVGPAGARRACRCLDGSATEEASQSGIAGWYKDWPLRDCRELDDRGAGGHGRGGTAGMDSGQRQQAGRPGVPGLAAERVHPGSRPSGSNGAGTYAKPLSARPRSCRRCPAARSAGAVSSQRWGLASNLIAFLASS
jgi:hypothetical protein